MCGVRMAETARRRRCDHPLSVWRSLQAEREEGTLQLSGRCMPGLR